MFWYVWATGNSMFQLVKIDSDQEWFSGVWSNVTVPNQPLWFREIGPDSSGYKQIEIFPAASASLTLNYEYYIKKPTDLTTSNLSSEIPTIPDIYHDAIEKGALYYFLKGFDDKGQMVAMADYEKAKQAIEEGDEKDMDGLLAFRWGRTQTLMPGFRLG